MSIQWGKQVTELSAAVDARKEGFDFVQPTAGSLAKAGLLETPHLREAARLTAADALPLTACAVPLPPEARVTERGFNLYAWMEHLKGAVPRLAEKGCRKLLWSDGRARVLPEEGDLAGLKEQLLQFLFLLGEVAASCHMIVLIEPLGPRRTNFLNSMGEVGDLLPRVGRDNLSSMISLRELEAIGLPLDELTGFRHLVQYVQLENPRARDGARACPRPSDGFDYVPFLRALKRMGYSGEIGLPADADGESLAFCRRRFDEA